MTTMTTNEAEIVRMNLPYLSNTQGLPRPWSEMTASEQAMTVFFIGQRDTITRTRVARHAIACHINSHDGTIAEDDANRIWALFFPQEI